MRVLLIGGGHTHVVALRQLARNPAPRIDLHLVSPEPTTSYSGLLPGHIAGHWPRETLEIPLDPLCRAAGATLHTTEVVHLDPETRTAMFADGNPFTFDYASLDIGAIAAIDAPESLANHGIPVKPLGIFADRWSQFLANVRSESRPPHAAIIGAGAAGIELALSMKYHLDSLRLKQPVCVSLIERSDDILPGGNDRLRKPLSKALDRVGVKVRTAASVTNATDTMLNLDSGAQVPACFIALATGAQPYPWLAQTGLTTHEGFVVVDPTLRSVSHPAIFACGDTAHLGYNPRPKAGVFAVRQGPVLADQIGRLARGEALTTYRPQSSYLKLISLGERRALADKWGLTFNLPGLWCLKRYIDLKFMEN
ncbi:MAG: FAD-dependent oxidoreductase [Hyphomonas sp.]|uniref:FAD-dependent oxidoreductase n=1 Tax=Hyphomonas sp. TaxID=87 RepID=UPI0030026DB9